MAIAEELKMLQDLHEKGQITDEEYATAKATTLGNQPPQRAGSNSGSRVGILIVCLLAIVGFIWYNSGTKATTAMVTTVIHAPIQLTDEVENLPAHAYKAVPFTLPYTGSVTINANLVRGNPVDVAVINANQLPTLQAQNWQQVQVYTDFNAQKTQVYERTSRLHQGNYYLVLRDMSLAVLSAPASDISVKIELKP